MELFKSIITNVLLALYQPFWFSVLLTFFSSVFYMYCYTPRETGQGIKKALTAWWKLFKESKKFRWIIALIFYSVMILFRTLLYRGLWLNPLQDVMGGWWIWKISSSTGEEVLTTECFENILLMMPFTFVLLNTLKNHEDHELFSIGDVVWIGCKWSFLFSLIIENAQLFFRLGTFQLSDLAYNTLGGVIGSIVYWIFYVVQNKKQQCKLKRRKFNK